MDNQSIEKTTNIERAVIVTFSAMFLALLFTLILELTNVVNIVEDLNSYEKIITFNFTVLKLFFAQVISLLALYSGLLFCTLKIICKIASSSKKKE